MSRMMKVVCLALFALFLTFGQALALDRNDMQVDERNALDTFFSNFSEAGVEPFTFNNVSNDMLIQFGVQHDKLNRSPHKSYDDQYWYVEADKVDADAYKYFGRHIVRGSTHKYPLVEGKFLYPKASGEAIFFSQIKQLIANEDGTYTAFVTEFMAGDVELDPHADNWENIEPLQRPRPQASWKAIIIKSTESGRYNLKEYLKVE